MWNQLNIYKLISDDLRLECKDKRIDQLSIYDFKGDKPKDGEYIDILMV